MTKGSKIPPTIIAINVALIVVGVLLCQRGFSIATGSDGSGIRSETGEIVAHRVALDERKWNANESTPIAVESTIAMSAGNTVSRRYFETGENA